MNLLPPNYQNAVVQADTLNILRDLPDSCVDMIWGDPDYNVGVKYAGKSYTAHWDAYIDWYIDLATESLRVLREDGNLFFINYPKQNAYLRVKYLDGAACEVNDYVWVYNTNVGHSPRRFTRAHRSILHVTKSPRNKFYKEQVAQPYLNPDDKRIRERIEAGSKGRMPYSWLNFNLVKNISRQKTKHPCQLPEELSDTFIRACTKPGDSLFVLFGGSGSEVVQAQLRGLTYLTCDLSEDYCTMITSRLQSLGSIETAYQHPARRRRR